MVATSKNYHNKKNFYLMVYHNIKSNGCLPSHKQHNISKQKLNYYVRGLKEANLIERIGYGVWKILRDIPEKEVKKEVKKTTIVTTIKSSKNYSKKNKVLRYHSIMFKIKLPNFNHWNSRAIFLKKKQIPYREFRGNRQSITHKGVKFILCSESILFFCPESVNIYGKSGTDCYNRAINWAKSQVLSFSNYLGIDLKKGGKWHLSIERGEIEETNNEIAIDYQKRKDKLEIWDKDDLWLITDKSLNTNNLEYKNPKKSLKDADKITPFLNDLRNNKVLSQSEQDLKINELENRIGNLINVIEKQQNILEKELNKGWNQWI